MTIIEILTELVDGRIDQVEARRLLDRHGENPDGSPLTLFQIQELIGQAPQRVKEAALGSPEGDREDALRELIALEPGRRSLFQRDVERRLPSGASGFLRRGLERRFDPVNTAFILRRGLGLTPFGPDLEGKQPQTFGDFLPAANYPGAGALRRLVSAAASLLRQDPGTLQGVRGGFAEDLRENPREQFNLALQSVIRSIPLELQGSFGRFAKRRFEAARLEQPEMAFLPGFVDRGFQFGLGE
jgi:hypothetical protein